MRQWRHGGMTECGRKILNCGSRIETAWAVSRLNDGRLFCGFSEMAGNEKSTKMHPSLRFRWCRADQERRPLTYEYLSRGQIAICSLEKRRIQIEKIRFDRQAKRTGIRRFLSNRSGSWICVGKTGRSGEWGNMGSTAIKFGREKRVRQPIGEMNSADWNDSKRLSGSAR
jgi:hypothetical protein